MFSLSAGAALGLGCGRDRETGGFYLHREMRLIWYVLHNTIIDMLIVLPLLEGLGGGAGMGPYCFHSLVQIKAC